MSQLVRLQTPGRSSHVPIAPACCAGSDLRTPRAGTNHSPDSLQTGLGVQGGEIFRTSELSKEMDWSSKRRCDPLCGNLGPVRDQVRPAQGNGTRPAFHQNVHMEARSDRGGAGFLVGRSRPGLLDRGRSSVSMRRLTPPRYVLRKCSRRTSLTMLGICRLPIRRSPSKLCAILDDRGDCAWTEPGPVLFFPVLRLWSAQPTARSAP